MKVLVKFGMALQEKNHLYIGIACLAIDMKLGKNELRFQTPDDFAEVHKFLELRVFGSAFN